MPGWLDKAKEAAVKAGEEAKKMAEAAKNANYGAMMDKTKNMAMHAADEAKKAAGGIMKKDVPSTTPDVIPQQDNPQGAVNPQAAPQQEAPVMPPQPSMQTAATQTTSNAAVLAKIAQVEHLLQEIKTLLK